MNVAFGLKDFYDGWIRHTMTREDGVALPPPPFSHSTIQQQQVVAQRNA